MAGTVEHMAVTLELLKKWREKDDPLVQIRDTDLFVLGNISPDSIMSRKGYERSMKMHTHFRDGIPDHDFGKPENLELFHRRVRHFAQGTLSDPELNRDFYLGYLTHILTDEIFILTVRPEFMKKISVRGLTDADPETFTHFTYDVNQIDFRLAGEYPGMQEAWAGLKRVKVCGVKDLITEAEMEDSRCWILKFFLENAEKYKEPVYYTYERALAFIQEAAAFVEGEIKKYIAH